VGETRSGNIADATFRAESAPFDRGSGFVPRRTRFETSRPILAKLHSQFPAPNTGEQHLHLRLEGHKRTAGENGVGVRGIQFGNTGQNLPSSESLSRLPWSGALPHCGGLCETKLPRPTQGVALSVCSPARHSLSVLGRMRLCYTSVD
jgi:hypothetical protein